MTMSESTQAAIVAETTVAFYLFFPFSTTLKFWLRHISENSGILTGSTAFWFGIRANQTLVWAHETEHKCIGVWRESD